MEYDALWEAVPIVLLQADYVRGWIGFWQESLPVNQSNTGLLLKSTTRGCTTSNEDTLQGEPTLRDICSNKKKSNWYKPFKYISANALKARTVVSSRSLGESPEVSFVTYRNYHTSSGGHLKHNQVIFLFLAFTPHWRRSHQHTTMIIYRPTQINSTAQVQ